MEAIARPIDPRPNQPNRGGFDEVIFDWLRLFVGYRIHEAHVAKLFIVILRTMVLALVQADNHGYHRFSIITKLKMQSKVGLSPRYSNSVD